jgi:SAM-dependent methyltransferase
MSTPQEQFKAGDAASYDGVAASFDYWTQRVTQPIADRLVELARVRPGQRVLDVGTGSGVVALALAKRISPGGKVVGIDLSGGMLNGARANATAAGMNQVMDFRRMDAETLQFDDAGFHAVLSLFAVLHLPDPERALREMFRVVMPGQRVVVGIGRGATFSFAGLAAVTGRLRERWNLARGRVLLAPQLLDTLVQKHIPLPAGHESPRSKGPVNLERLFRKIGFLGIQAELRSHTHSISSREEFWDLQSTFSSVARKRLSSASAAQMNRVRTEFFDRCGRVLHAGGTLVYRNGALIVSGNRPHNKVP